MRNHLSAEAVIKLLDLEPLHPEGGYFRRTHEAKFEVKAHGSVRHSSTAIYFLLTPETFAALHRIKSEEVFNFYQGDSVELFIEAIDGRVERHVLGVELLAGERPQVLVPENRWQCARILAGPYGYSLLGTTVSPGFEFDDFEMGVANNLKDMPTEAVEIFKKFIRS